MAKTFPYIEVAGSYSDIGHAIGESQKEKIKKHIQFVKNKAGDQYSDYLTQAQEYWHLTEPSFPQYLEELQAIAQSANVDALDYFLCNSSEVFDPESDVGNESGLIYDHCTIAVSFNENGVVIGHNEDWRKEAIDEIYLLKAKIGSTTFFTLNYAWALPSVGVGLNSWGLAQGENYLNQKPQLGIPKVFLCRAITDAKTLDQAEDITRQFTWASGFNHVLAQNHEVRDLEVAPGHNQIGIQKTVSEPYIHTNHCLTNDAKQSETFYTRSSLARYTRAKELVRNDMTREDMIALLSDTENQELPICRPDATIASVVLLPNKREIYVCHGHPCTGEFVKYTL